MVQVFSFCLYNPPNPLYYIGLFENVAMIQKYFPTFLVYVYIGNDVPSDTCDELRKYPNVRPHFTGETGATNMIHRFFAIDDPDVDAMIVRDADSRVHWKDRWAIGQFLVHPAAKVHTIRDAPVHTTAIMGGLWGMKKMEGINMHELYAEYSEHIPPQDMWGADQYFLRIAFYPRIKHTLLIHSSNGWKHDPSETLVSFPFLYSKDVFCGRDERGSYTESVPRAKVPSILTTIHSPR